MNNIYNSILNSVGNRTNTIYSNALTDPLAFNKVASSFNSWATQAGNVNSLLPQGPEVTIQNVTTTYTKAAGRIADFVAEIMNPIANNYFDSTVGKAQVSIGNYIQNVQQKLITPLTPELIDWMEGDSYLQIFQNAMDVYVIPYITIDGSSPIYKIGRQLADELFWSNLKANTDYIPFVPQSSSTQTLNQIQCNLFGGALAHCNMGGMAETSSSTTTSTTTKILNGVYSPVSGQNDNFIGTISNPGSSLLSKIEKSTTDTISTIDSNNKNTPPVDSQIDKQNKDYMVVESVRTQPEVEKIISITTSTTTTTTTTTTTSTTSTTSTTTIATTEKASTDMLTQIIVTSTTTSFNIPDCIGISGFVRDQSLNGIYKKVGYSKENSKDEIFAKIGGVSPIFIWKSSGVSIPGVSSGAFALFTKDSPKFNRQKQNTAAGFSPAESPPSCTKPTSTFPDCLSDEDGWFEIEFFSASKGGSVSCAEGGVKTKDQNCFYYLNDRIKLKNRIACNGVVAPHDESFYIRV